MHALNGHAPQPIFFFSKKFKHFFFFFQKCLNLLERSEISWIERKTKFQIFQIFIFRVIANFVTSSSQFLMSFHDNPKNKNWQKNIILYLILFSTLRIINRNWIKTEGRGVYISVVGKNPLNLQYKSQMGREFNVRHIRILSENILIKTKWIFFYS